MKSVAEFLSEDQLNEKLLLINNGRKYGQILFLGGAAASGKGFAASHFINSEDFRSINIDDGKKLALAVADKKDKFPEIKGLDQTDPEQANTVHQWMNKLGFRDKSLKNVLAANTNKETLPNLIFDESLKDMKRINTVLPLLLAAGYDPKNIHLIWVLTKFEIAVKFNAQRDRVLRDDLLLKSHTGARDSMWGIINGTIPKGMNGGIYVLLNNPKNTISFKTEDGKDYRTVKDNKTSEIRVSTGTGKISGKLVGKKGKKHEMIVKDFKYLVYKKPNKSPFKEKELKKQLYYWVIENTPKKDRNIFI